MSQGQNSEGYSSNFDELPSNSTILSESGPKIEEMKSAVSDLQNVLTVNSFQEFERSTN